MQLNFSPLRSYTTPTGQTIYMREAIPDESFWPVWRMSRIAFANQGLEVFQKKDDLGEKYWTVRQTLTKNPDLKFEAVKVKPYSLQNTSKLRGYQIDPCAEIIASQVSNRASFDGSDTGCGKTYMGLASARELNLKPGIVCTKTGIADWKKVCQYFGINPLFVINWESIRSNKFPYCTRHKDGFSGKYFFKWNIPRNFPSILFFDEIHKAAGSGTQNQQILIAAKEYRVHVMSATAADKMKKLQTLLDVLGVVPFNDFDNFLKDKGLVLDSKGNWTSLNEKEDLININKLIFPAFGTRLNKNEIPGFPEVQNIARLVPVAAPDRQNKQYLKIKNLIRECKGKNSAAQRMVLQLRYRQMAEHQKVDILKEAALEYLEQGFAVCIFVNFKQTLEDLAKKLKTKCLVHGEQKGKKGDIQRAECIADFQADKERLIILNIASGGASINLHDLNGKYARVSLICPTWNAIELKQVLGRIHRDGARSKAMNVLFYGEKTIEEKIYEKVSAKLDNIQALNDGDLAEFELFKESV